MICDGRARTAVWLFAVHCMEEMIAELSERWSEARDAAKKLNKSTLVSE